MSSAVKRFYDFGGFRLDAAEHLLYGRGGELVPLKPKVVETLELLVRERGRLLGKDELMERLWPDAVVEESNLSQNIYLLRKVLGTDAGGRGYIETIPKRGYRFTAEVVEVCDNGRGEEAPAAKREVTASAGAVGPAGAGAWPWRRKIVALALALALAGGGLAFALKRFDWRGEREQPAMPFQSVRLKRITDRGDIADAALSPDGKQVAYSTYGNAVWIQNLATGSRLQLFADSPTEERRGLSFSPDGNHLYLYRNSQGGNGQLVRVPVLGGAAQRLFENFWTTPALAPDGQRFAFMRWDIKGGAQSLIVAEAGGERTVTTRRLPDYFELWGKTVAWSPDGKLLACVEWLSHDKTSVASVLVVNAADGTGMRLPNGGRKWSFLYDLVWLPGGDGLLVVAREDISSAYQVWRVSYPEGHWHKVTNDLSDYDKLSVSADGGRMVAVQQTEFTNLWLLPQGDLRRARQITFGNGRTDGRSGISWAPDGRIVFVSNASGSPQLWIADADGTNLRQLTYGGEPSTQPFVSPDGHHVVFKAVRGNKPHVWRMDIDGANPLQLTDGLRESGPTVTPDGRDVLYSSGGTLFTTIWSVPLAGGAPRQLTEGYATDVAIASPDGRLLAAGLYDPDAKPPTRLGIFPAAGGPPVASFEGPVREPLRWTPDGRYLIFINNDRNGIWKQPLNGGARTRLLTLPPPERVYNFAFSPDYTQLLIARGRPQSDVLLIEDVKKE